MNRSRDQKGTNLPRINSQTRVHTAQTHYNQRKETQQETHINSNRGASGRGNSLTVRRTLGSAQTSKAFKNQTTGVIYAKKIEELQKQNLILTRELGDLEGQINNLRQQKMNKKRKEQIIGNDDERSIVSSSSMNGLLNFRKNLNCNNPNAIKSEIKLTENKVDALRRKIDKQTDRNNATKKEIDSLRKQISTIKTLSNQLQTVYTKTNQKYEEQTALSKKLEELIAQKNSNLHKKRVQSMHAKAQMIKQYDTILKTLDREIEADKVAMNNVEDTKSNRFYITQVGIGEKDALSSTQMTSPTKRRINYSKEIHVAKAQLQQCEQQFEVLKHHIGTANADQITQDFMERYQKNFQHYKFIQELYQNLQELKLEKQELEKRKTEILENLQSRNSQTKEKEIFHTKLKLHSVVKEKQACKQNIQQFQKALSQLKRVIKLLFQKVDMQNKLPLSQIKQLDENNILVALSLIEQRYNYLSSFGHENVENINYANNEVELEEMIEISRRETENTKGEKLLTREDFIKACENIASKKKKNDKAKPLPNDKK